LLRRIGDKIFTTTEQHLVSWRDVVHFLALACPATNTLMRRIFIDYAKHNCSLQHDLIYSAQHMKTALLGSLVAMLFAQSDFAYTAKRMVCSQTGKEVKACCCIVKDGKFVCKMTNKSFEKFCCESR
jgi:hypothetical protein